MLGDVLTGLFAAVELRTWLADNGDRAEPLKRPDGMRSPTDLANSVSTAARSSRAPLACHVGLAESDQAVAADSRASRSG